VLVKKDTPRISQKIKKKVKKIGVPTLHCEQQTEASAAGAHKGRQRESSSDDSKVVEYLRTWKKAAGNKHESHSTTEGAD